MSAFVNRMTEAQVKDLISLASELQMKAENGKDRDTAVMAYAVQQSCSELLKLREQHAASMNTITSLMEILGPSDSLSISGQVAELKARCEALAVEAQTVKAMNDCLSEELRGYESDGAFEGPKMHLLWWQCETPATDAFLAEVRAQVWIEAKDFTKSMLACDSVDHLDFLFDGKVQQLRKGVQS